MKRSYYITTQEEYLKTLSLDELLYCRYKEHYPDYRSLRTRYNCQGIKIKDLKPVYYYYGKRDSVSKITYDEIKSLRFCLGVDEGIAKAYVFDKKFLYAELATRPHKLRKYDKKKGGRFAIYKLTKHEMKLNQQKHLRKE